jgi:phosphoglycolate phosphatase-like HAD superfamily hydrolase
MTATLVLWDIDHTLIETRGVGGKIYADAFLKVTGAPLKAMPEMAGRTEPVIFREALKINSIADGDDLYLRFAAEQAQGYIDRTGELRRIGRALPGAAAALRALATIPGTIQSVLTGNTRPAAQAKLRTFHLEQYLDLDIGAFGTDDDIRSNLVSIARQRAEERLGHHFDANHIVLIGDTPNDVSAALENGVRIVAVATGRDTRDDLLRAGAGIVFTDLADTDSLIRILHP